VDPVSAIPKDHPFPLMKSSPFNQRHLKDKKLFADQETISPGLLLELIGVWIQVSDLSLSGTFQQCTMCNRSHQIQFGIFQHHTTCSQPQRSDLSHACAALSSLRAGMVKE
jgi:hypothetical protein